MEIENMHVEQNSTAPAPSDGNLEGDKASGGLLENLDRIDLLQSDVPHREYKQNIIDEGQIVISDPFVEVKNPRDSEVSTAQGVEEFTPPTEEEVRERETLLWSEGADRRWEGSRRGSLRAEQFNEVTNRIFDRVDSNQNGFLDRSELHSAVRDSRYYGQDAQLVAGLYANYDQLQGLANDEWGGENSGVSRQDIDRAQNGTTIWNHEAGSVQIGMERVARDVDDAQDRIIPELFPFGEDPLEVIGQTDMSRIFDEPFDEAFYVVAEVDPAIIRDMISTNEDGSYTVTFPGDPENPVTVQAPTDQQIGILGNHSYEFNGESTTDQFGRAERIVDYTGYWPSVLETAVNTYQSNSDERLEADDVTQETFELLTGSSRSIDDYYESYLRGQYPGWFLKDS